MRRSRLAVVVLLLAPTGCHSYEPMALEEVRPQMQVRARLTSSQAEELADFLPGDDRLIHGTVIEDDGARLLLLVPVATATRRGSVETLNQRLGVPHAGLLEIELQKLDRLKTGALTAAGVLAIGYVLFESLRGGSAGETPGGGPGGPDDALIPFRIPIGG